MGSKGTGFVICPLGEEGSTTRLRSEKVFKYILKPALEDCEYVALSSTDIDSPGLITSQVIRNLKNAPLVIADLTELNANVLYELGVRHAFGKPVIHIIQTGQKIPFDNKNFRTVFIGTEVDVAARAKEDIVKKIKAVEDANFEVENPVTEAVMLEKLSFSSKTNEQLMANLWEGQDQIRQQIEEILGIVRYGNSPLRNILSHSVPVFKSFDVGDAEFDQSINAFKGELCRFAEGGERTSPLSLRAKHAALLELISLSPLPNEKKATLFERLENLWTAFDLDSRQTETS